MSILMTRVRTVTTGVLAAACVLTLAGGVVATAPASAASHAVAVANPLICQAAVSNSRPKDNTTVTVVVRTKVAAASVTTTAKYKTTKTTHTGKTASTGNASIPYRIGRATIGYKVVVSVSVKARGLTKTCSTSFTPSK
jgi:hypothetical protein